MTKLKLLMASLALIVGGAIPANAAQTPVADGIYYLYNANANKFLSHRDYGALGVPCVDDFGVPVQLVADGDNFKIKFYDHKESGGQTVYLAGQYWCSAWDQTGDAFSLTIVDGEVPSYKIHNVTKWSSNNSQYVYYSLSTVTGEEYRLAANSADGSNLKNEGQIVWQFLSKAEYDAKMAEYINATYTSVLSSANRNDIDANTFVATMEGDNWARKDLTSKIGTATFSGSIGSWTWSQWRNRDGQPVYGTNYCEIFQATGNLTQTVTGLDEGIYKVTVQGFERAGSNADCVTFGAAGYDNVSTFLEANGQRVKFASWYSDRAGDANPNGPSEGVALFNNNKYVNEVYTYVGSDGKLDITVSVPKFVVNRWVLFNNFTLTYYSDAVSDGDATEILTTAAGLESEIMQASLKDELTSAQNTFDGARTIVNYNALSAAVTAAQTSIAAYANAKNVLDQINAYLTAENTYCNLYTTEAYNTYYADILTAYNNRTLTTAAANAVSYGSRVTGNLPAILLSSWKVGEQTAIAASFPYINTWSVEGNTDGSKFYTPFYEYWVGSGNVLAAKTFTSTITGLEANTTYTVLLRARVQPTDNQTMIDNAVMMKVGSGDAVCISGGAKFGTTNYYIGNFSAVGTTDAEGNLITTITVADASNVSWLSFYNVRYTEGEDLSAYIADYEFALSTATANSTSSTYANVTGKEKTDLGAALTTYASVDNTDKTALIAAKEALETANSTFINAVAAYNAFAELNQSVASTLDVTLPTITSTTVAADLDDYIVAEYTAAKAYTNDYTDKLGAWTNAPGTNKSQSWDGTANDTYYDLYNSEDRAMTQTVTLPAGNYALIAKGRASVNGLLTLTVGTETVTFPHKGNTGRGIATDGTATFADDATTYANSNNGCGWEYRVMTFTSDGESATTLTFNWTTANNNWCGLDDIELRCNPTVLDYTALQTAYNEVTVPTLGFEKDEYAPYVNAENFVKIAAAKNLLDNQDAYSQNAIDAAKNNITSLTWTQNQTKVNAFYDGTFATQAPKNDGNDGTAVSGWTTNENIRTLVKSETEGTALYTATTGHSGMYVWNGAGATYGETDGYTVPLHANQIYTLSYKRGSWDSDGSSTYGSVSITGPDATTIPLVGESLYACYYKAGGELAQQRFYFVAPVEGNYVFVFGCSGNTVFTDIQLYSVDNNTLEFDENNALPAYASGTYPNVQVARSIKAGYNTLVLPFSMTEEQVKETFGEGAKVYVVNKYENDNITFVSQTTINANEPCILVSEKNVTELNLANVAVSSATSNPTKEGTSVKMIGSYAASTEIEADANNYVVSAGELWLVEESAVSMKGTRAYIQLTVTGTAPSRLTWSFDGDATGIAELTKKTEATEGAIYNLQGQQLNGLQRGINIVNGKKVLVK